MDNDLVYLFAPPLIPQDDNMDNDQDNAQGFAHQLELEGEQINKLIAENKRLRDIIVTVRILTKGTQDLLNYILK